MKIIAHRRNTIADLEATPAKYGIEMDLRSYGTELVVHHEPFTRGVAFADWLDHFHHGTLILNVKEEGLEDSVLELVRARSIEDYFFLDQSFPFLVKTVHTGERRCAVRVSEFESIDTALSLAGKAQWVWVDCFTRFPLSGEEAQRLQNAGMRLCLVSPELQGFEAMGHIPPMRAMLAREGINADAVCTKRPDLWEC